MIFLIEYNRREGHIVTFLAFDDSLRREAEEARLKVELDLNCEGVGHEVVLLEATTEDELRRTHRRYFENLRQLLESGSDRDGKPGVGRNFEGRSYSSTHSG